MTHDMAGDVLRSFCLFEAAAKLQPHDRATQEDLLDQARNVVESSRRGALQDAHARRARIGPSESPEAAVRDTVARAARAAQAAQHCIEELDWEKTIPDLRTGEAHREWLRGVIDAAVAGTRSPPAPAPTADEAKTPQRNVPR
jgi:hypothetical protein